jgi:hypothetical protein
MGFQTVVVVDASKVRDVSVFFSNFFEVVPMLVDATFELAIQDYVLTILFAVPRVLNSHRFRTKPCV